MSIREKVAINLVDALKAIDGVSFVTREPFDFNKLSNAQFPAILVQTATDQREDVTINGNAAQRLATTDYNLVCYVKGATIDTARNNLLELVEEKLDADRTRGNNVLETQVLNVETDEGELDPIGGLIINLRTIYEYTRGIL